MRPCQTIPRVDIWLLRSRMRGRNLGPNRHDNHRTNLVCPRRSDRDAQTQDHYPTERFHVLQNLRHTPGVHKTIPDRISASPKSATKEGRGICRAICHVRLSPMKLIPLAPGSLAISGSRPLSPIAPPAHHSFRALVPRSPFRPCLPALPAPRSAQIDLRG